jgi:hypothetical protein
MACYCIFPAAAKEAAESELFEVKARCDEQLTHQAQQVCYGIFQMQTSVSMNESE